MSIQGIMQPDHAPINAYEFLILDLPKIVFTKVDGAEEEVETVDLPDRSQASGGNTKPVEFTAQQALHHKVEVAALEVWYNLGRGNVAEGYKKNGSMVYKTISGAVAKVIPMTEIFIKKRKYPDVDMENAGDAGMIVWTFSAKLVL